MKAELKAGDLFAVNSPNLLGKCIRFIEKLWAWDREAAYNHAGVIIGQDGSTMEALLTFRISSLDKYRGQKILIVRHKEMTFEKFSQGLYALNGEIGRVYPVYRLVLFLIPPLAKISTFGRGVCSEQTAKFLCAAGFGNVKFGITPDNLADLWRESKSMDIIFEGIW